MDPYRKAQAAAAATNDPRAIERDLLLRVTRALELADEKGDRFMMIKAITDNQSLWTIFVSDVVGQGNKLPAELRASIASVGMAVIKEMSENFENPDIPFLVEVNRNIIAGLSERPAAGPAPQRPSREISAEA